MKKSLLGLILSFVVITAAAQTNRSTIAGTVIDANKEGVVGAVIEIMSMRDTTDRKYANIPRRPYAAPISSRASPQGNIVLRRRSSVTRPYRSR